MDLRKITARFIAAPQISPEDMPAIAATGVTRVVCNRPDNEVPPAYQAAAMQSAAEAAGLEFYVRPLTHQSMTAEVIAQNWAFLTECDGPVLAYCASGTRSTIAWALAAVQDMEVDDIITAAGAGGYDLSSLRQTLVAVART